MDSTVVRIADYAHDLRFADLPPQAVHHCKRVIVDTYGCALGAFDAQPARIAREIASRTTVPDGARILGTNHRTLPELAAFANGCMSRYLDGNDVFGGGGGHPSDMIAAVFAAGEISKADGPTLINALVIAYEVYYSMWRGALVRHNGLDTMLYTSTAGAVGVGKVLGLNRDQMVEAISLAVTPNVALDATRYGIMGMWKGCAGPNAARNAVFAAQLAQAGMTGAEKPIEGDHGLQNLLGRKFELPTMAGRGQEFAIGKSMLKYYLAETHIISPMAAVQKLCEQGVKVENSEDVDSITVHVYKWARDVVGLEPEKWRPETREAADHSLPYVVAAMLMEGGYSARLFDEERLHDTRLLSILDKVEIKEDEEYTRQFPQKYQCRIEVAAKNGELKVAENDYPRGHVNNPMTDEEVSIKFRGLAANVLPKDRVESALKALWNIDTTGNLDAIYDTTRVARAGNDGSARH